MPREQPDRPDDEDDDRHREAPERLAHRRQRRAGDLEGRGRRGEDHARPARSRPRAGPAPAPTGARRGRPRDVRHGRPRAGSRSARRARAPPPRRPRRVEGPVLGRWNVIVDVGPHDRVGELARGQVHGGRAVDGEDGHAGRAGAIGQLDGRADRLAEDARERRSRAARRSTIAARSTPWPSIATSRATGDVDRARRPRAGRGDPSCGPRRGSAAAPPRRRARPRPAPRARPAAGPPRSRRRRCCRGRTRTRIGPVPHRSLSTARARAAAATAVPRVLHEPDPGHAEPLGLRVGPGHLGGGHRGARHGRGPAGDEPVEVELEQGGVVGGQRSAPGGVAGAVGGRHRRGRA